MYKKFLTYTYPNTTQEAFANELVGLLNNRKGALQVVQILTTQGSTPHLYHYTVIFGQI